jgi:hypothetical protein
MPIFFVVAAWVLFPHLLVLAATSDGTFTTNYCFEKSCNPEDCSSITQPLNTCLRGAQNTSYSVSCSDDERQLTYTIFDTVTGCDKKSKPSSEKAQYTNFCMNHSYEQYVLESYMFVKCNIVLSAPVVRWDCPNTSTTCGITTCAPTLSLPNGTCIQGPEAHSFRYVCSTDRTLVSVYKWDDDVACRTPNAEPFEVHNVNECKQSGFADYGFWSC